MLTFFSSFFSIHVLLFFSVFRSFKRNFRFACDTAGHILFAGFVCCFFSWVNGNLKLTRIQAFNFFFAKQKEKNVVPFQIATGTNSFNFDARKYIFCDGDCFSFILTIAKKSRKSPHTKQTTQTEQSTL